MQFCKLIPGTASRISQLGSASLIMALLIDCWQPLEVAGDPQDVGPFGRDLLIGHARVDRDGKQPLCFRIRNGDEQSMGETT